MVPGKARPACSNHYIHMYRSKLISDRSSQPNEAIRNIPNKQLSTLMTAIPGVPRGRHWQQRQRQPSIAASTQREQRTAQFSPIRPGSGSTYLTLLTPARLTALFSARSAHHISSIIGPSGKGLKPLRSYCQSAVPRHRLVNARLINVTDWN